MIRRTIHRVRQKSREERVAFASMVAVAVTGVLFLGWGAYLFISFRNALHSTDSANSAPPAATSTPLDFNNDSAAPVNQTDYPTQ